MWKGTTARKVLDLPKSERGGRLLFLGSAIFLLIAVIAAVVGFRDGPSTVKSGARGVSILAALGFIGLAGIGFAARSRSR